MHRSGSNFGVCDHSNKVLEGYRLLWSVLYLSHLRLYSPHRLLAFICEQTNFVLFLQLQRTYLFNNLLLFATKILLILNILKTFKHLLEKWGKLFWDLAPFWTNVMQGCFFL